MTSLKIYLQQSHINFKISSIKINVHTEKAMLVNALRHKYEGSRPNSHVICAQTYTIKLFSIFHFLCGFGFFFFFFTHTKQKQYGVLSQATKNKIYTP